MRTHVTTVVVLLKILSVVERKHRVPMAEVHISVALAVCFSVPPGKSMARRKLGNAPVQRRQEIVVPLTCLTSTFFMTTIGDSAGKALPAVLEFCLGLSSRLQPKALSMSSDSICSAELRHSELPSAGQKNGQFT